MTPEQREQEIRARCDRATPGPWGTWPDGTEESVESLSLGRFVCHLNSNMRDFRADSAFIAGAREDVPWLLAQLAEARREAASLRAAGDAMARAMAHREHDAEHGLFPDEGATLEAWQALTTRPTHGAGAGEPCIDAEEPVAEPHPYDPACRKTQHAGCTCRHLVDGRWCGKPRHHPVHATGAGE